MDSKFISDVKRLAEEHFASGLYCAESVVLALAKAQGLETEVLPRAATAFCSGMARTGGPCGALTGAVMGVSLALGRSSAAASVQPAYVATQKLVREFEAAFGARNCDALLGCDLATDECQRRFKEEKLHVRCAQYTSGAAAMAARIILNSTTSPIDSVTDVSEIRALLAACDLPVADVDPSDSMQFFGCRADSELVGVVGLEIHGTAALLRSLAVAPAHRNYRLGSALVSHAEARAESLGVQSLYLLTTSAQDYFAKLGYSPASRAEAPPGITATAQFRGLCPATAVFMSKRLADSARDERRS